MKALTSLSVSGTCALGGGLIGQTLDLVLPYDWPPAPRHSPDRARKPLCLCATVSQIGCGFRGGEIQRPDVPGIVIGENIFASKRGNLLTGINQPSDDDPALKEIANSVLVLIDWQLQSGGNGACNATLLPSMYGQP